MEDFLNTRPSRAQMYAFIENMRDPARRKAELERRIARICDFVGIAEPTGTEKLLALHIGLLQEQNQALDRLTNRTAQVAAQTGQHPPVLGPVLAALLIDRVL
ncbi:hypothetical protein [Burkholderia sp. Ac-20365]|uniref:hypothetical protein n=1 Tax=Burkholderia sp. Ac-20365 TaxID=2703897 RepID=UPI00197B235A|nr:hypothetical protein [Burkholderia sp. Ac-20365]MBN3761108.1 hypothetical protein [Burkholderia sp. Ac-20365]